MSKLLAQLGPGGAFTAGLFLKYNKDAVPLWTDGVNVVFDKGEVRNAPSWTDVKEFPSNIDFILEAYQEGVRRVFVVTANRGYVLEGEVWQEVVSWPSDSGGNGYVETWGDWAIFSINGAQPKLWKNTSAIGRQISGVPFDRAKIFRRFFSHLCAYNTNNESRSVEWSDTGDIENFEVDFATRAGFATLYDADGPLLAAEPLNNEVLVYSTNTTFRQGFIGGNSVFSFQPGPVGIGALGKYAVVGRGGDHWGLGPKGIFQTNGYDFKYLTKPDTYDWIVENVDMTRNNQVKGYDDTALKQVIWHFDAIGGGRKGIGVSYEDGSIHKYELPLGAVAGQRGFAYSFGAVDKTLVALGQDKRTKFATSLASRPLDLGAKSQYKFFDYAELTGEYSGLEVQFGVHDEFHAEPSWLAWKSAEDYLGIDREAVYLSCRLRSTATGALWNVTGMGLYGEAAGFVR